MKRKFRVLLIEDNPGDVDLARETFGTSGHDVDLVVARDGVEAMEILFQSCENRALLPDLILLDLNLPRKDGRQVLNEIKAQELLRAIPVVVLTSSWTESDVLESYHLGANCYITKPGELQALRSTVSGIEKFWFSVARLPPLRPAVGGAE